MFLKMTNLHDLKPNYSFLKTKMLTRINLSPFKTNFGEFDVGILLTDIGGLAYFHALRGQSGGSENVPNCFGFIH